MIQDDDNEEKHHDPCIDFELENISAENDQFLSEYRRKRLSELQTTILQPLDRNGCYSGEVYTAHKESEILEWTTKEPLVIVHFFHPSFKTCEVLDLHLKILALKYAHIRWARMNVSDAPFLTQKLAIRMLPCLDIFISGIKSDRIVGFDELGGSVSFSTHNLEKRVALSGTLGGCLTVLGIFKKASNKHVNPDADDGSDTEY